MLRQTARVTAVVAAVWATFVICSGCKEATSRWGRSAWIGTWKNADSEARGLTKMVIRVEDSAYTIEAWGACTPKDCHWGKVIGQVPQLSTDRITTTWVTTFAIKQVDLRLNEDGTVEATIRTRFTDQSERADYEREDRFVKADQE